MIRCTIQSSHFLIVLLLLILNTHFKGVAAHGSIVNFVYDAMYLDTHNTGGLAYTDLIVSYNPVTKEISADYRG